MVVNVLREWKLACPKGDLNLVFPASNGRVTPYQTLRWKFDAVQVAAGIAPSIAEPKYGLHSLRHFFASWCINQRSDGGLGLPIKAVQERLGHSSIQMTGDVYGHLFPALDDGAELAQAERALIGLASV
jgi:integrase